MPNMTDERGTTTTSTVDSSDSAKGFLTSYLEDNYGLGALADWAWNKWLNGEGIDQIKLELYQTPEFKARYPAMEALAKQGRAISVEEYRNLEKSYTQVLHSYGLPQGFYDTPSDFARFMTGNVSPSELNDRVKEYTGAVLGDQQTLTEMSRLYGDLGHSGNPAGDLLAHYLDPDVAAPLLTEKLQASQFASAAKRSGFGQIDRAQAEQFGAQADISPDQAISGFGQLVHGRELMQGLPGEGQDQITQTEQLGAAFGGDALAQEKLANRARLRVAEGQGGGGFSQNRTGAAAGLGSNQV